MSDVSLHCCMFVPLLVWPPRRSLSAQTLLVILCCCPFWFTQGKCGATSEQADSHAHNCSISHPYRLQSSRPKSKWSPSRSIYHLASRWAYASNIVITTYKNKFYSTVLHGCMTLVCMEQKRKQCDDTQPFGWRVNKMSDLQRGAECFSFLPRVSVGTIVANFSHEVVSGMWVFLLKMFRNLWRPLIVILLFNTGKMLHIVLLGDWSYK